MTLAIVQRNRKKIARQVEQRTGQQVGWRGGVLVFLSTGLSVSGVPVMPKPGKEALGMVGAQQERQPKALKPEVPEMNVEKNRRDWRDEAEPALQRRPVFHH